MMDSYDDMIKTIEEYYGSKYIPIVKKLLVDYLKKNIRVSEIKTVFSLLIRTYSNQYKMPPDIALFEKILDDTFYNECVLIDCENKTQKYIEDRTNYMNEVVYEKPVSDNIFEKLKDLFR